jgi:hypothetical protein
VQAFRQASQLGADCKPFYVRHQDVQQHQIGTLPDKCLESKAPVFSLFDHPPRLLERLTGQQSRNAIIVDDQDPRPAFVHHHAAVLPLLSSPWKAAHAAA